jgi:hypothetical protein
MNTAQPKRITIRKCELTIRVYSGNGKRFASLFWQAWQQFPSEVRAALLSEWSRRETGNPGAWLVTDWAERQPFVLAQCREDGRKLWFYATFVERLSPPAVQALVAHELAHAYRFITKAEIFVGETEEKTTDATAHQWGFDQDLLCREYTALCSEQIGLPVSA